MKHLNEDVIVTFTEEGSKMILEHIGIDWNEKILALLVPNKTVQIKLWMLMMFVGDVLMTHLRNNCASSTHSSTIECSSDGMLGAPWIICHNTVFATVFDTTSNIGTS